MNRLMKLPSVLLIGLICSQAWAQESMQSNISSLQRFDSSQILGSNSDFEVRDVFIGESVLKEVGELSLQGGKVHYIAGGNRSSRVKVSFFQPYNETQLEQLLLLNFDKDNGFVTSVNLTYSLKSRYSDIAPVYLKVLTQATKKYGDPMSFADVNAVTNSSKTEVRLSEFINKLDANAEVQEQIRAYFQKKLVTPRTHFSDNGEGKAILKFGFRQCYFWPKQKFAEVLSLCSFQPSSGNRGAQGITVALESFIVQADIANFRSADDDGIEIEL